MNDYIGVHKVVLPELEKQDFFREIVNEETIIEVDINDVNFNVRINVQKTSAKNKFWLHIVDITEKNSQLLSTSQTRP